MIEYEYFGPQGQRRSAAWSEDRGAAELGRRLLLGFPVRQLDVRDREDKLIALAWFEDGDGHVWALYCWTIG